MRGRSPLEMKARFDEATVFAFIEAVQARRTMRDVLLDLVRLDLYQQIHGEHALAEVALVQRALEHQLVEVLQLREREAFGQELEANRLRAHLYAQALVCAHEDMLVWPAVVAGRRQKAERSRRRQQPPGRSFVDSRFGSQRKAPNAHRSALCGQR